MRILDGDVIVHMAVLLILMISLLFLNVAGYVNKVGKRSNWCLHAASFFLLSILVLQFLMEAIMEMEIEKGVIAARNVLLAPTAVFTAILLWSVLRGSRNGIRFELYPHLENMFGRIEDAVVIFDLEGRAIRIYDKNDYLGFPDKPREVLEQLTGRIPGEIAGNLENQCVFDITDPSASAARQVLLSSIRSEKGHLLGYSAVIHDVSDYHRLFSMLEEKNSHLKESNERLLHEVEVLELLESEKQRLGLITKIQEELVIRIEKAICSIDSLEKGIQSGRNPDKSDLVNLSGELNLIYKEVRRVVRTITAKGDPLVDKDNTG